MSIICDKLEFTTQCLSDVTTTDSLTGLQNRDSFMAVLEKEMARIKRYDTALSVFLMDMDDFQSINLTYGAETGDGILSEVAQFVLRHVRSSDQACRYGGQQFAVMLVNTPSTQAQSVCERLRQDLSEHRFECHDSSLHISVSIGFVSINTEQNHTPAEIIEMASKALQQAKALGQNRVEAYKG